jgi:hypothetical protein
VSEHAVIAHFDYAEDSIEPLFDLEEELEDAIESAKAGEYDGHEIAVDLSDGTLYMYGPDADCLFAKVRSILAGALCLRNVRVVLRYGPPEDGVRERTLTL